jgi:hypothetical protein
MSKYPWTCPAPEHCTINASIEATMPTLMPPPHKTNITMWQMLQGNRTTNINAQRDPASIVGRWDILPKIATATLRVT